MRKALVIIFALALSACGLARPETAQAPPPVASAPAAQPSKVKAIADTVQIRGTQALILANLSYQSIGTPVAVALESGAVPGPIKERVKALDRKVIGALRAGRTARDEAGKARAAAEALDALGIISALTGIKLPSF